MGAVLTAAGCAGEPEGPSCEEVAEHLVALVRDAPETQALPDDIRLEVEAQEDSQRPAEAQRCELGRWSAELRQCKRAAASPAAASACERGRS